ncbi:hypothetical protein MPSEU_000104700 [Mayamaea pseudoterrestris]|nr:hypothetical protein MPSEU_000104700 [Mayamaea pseudoterrestris]
MTTERTRLVPATRGDEAGDEENLIDANGGQQRQHQQHEPLPVPTPTPLRPQRSCLLQTFILIRIISTLITLCFILSQVGLWVIVPGIIVQMILRSYVILFCIILMAAEWNIKILPDFLSPANNEAYKNWFYRGFQYSFIGVIGLEESYATLGHNYPDTPSFAQIAFADILRGSAFAMFGMGILYMIMRLLFLNKLWELVDARYHQQLEEVRRQQNT